MANEHLNEQYYRILNANPGCDWDELRRAYKKQIQKWHPDRFTATASKQQAEAAEDKIKRINIAYNFFSEYYREHGNLPSVKTKAFDVKKSNNAAAAEPRKSEPDKSKQRFEENTQEKGGRSFLFYVFIAAVLLITYFISNYEDEQIKPRQEETARYHDTNNTSSDHGSPSTNTAGDDESEKKDHPAVVHRPERYFTYGSTIGDVIIAQGTPTRIDGETWYYGNAEVYFKDGIVTAWKRDPDTPLNIKMTIE